MESEFLKSLGITEENVEKVKKGLFDVITSLPTKDDFKTSLSEVDTQLSKGVEKVKTWMKGMAKNIDKISFCANIRTTAEKVGWNDYHSRELAFVYYESSAPAKEVSDETLSEFLTKLLTVYQENIAGGKTVEEAFAFSKEGMKLL
jgi:hypothetical protein